MSIVKWIAANPEEARKSGWPETHIETAIGVSMQNNDSKCPFCGHSPILLLRNLACYCAKCKKQWM